MQLSILVLHIVGIVRRRLGIDMAITELIIDRAHWGAGLLLRSDDNTMCCLGFASLACGVPINYIKDIGMPQYSWFEVNPWMRTHPGAGGRGRDTAININDDDTITGPEKEAKLIHLFDKNGVKLSFTGEYRPGIEHGNC